MATPKLMMRSTLRTTPDVAVVPRGKQWIVTAILAHNPLASTDAVLRVRLDDVPFWEIKLVPGATFDVETKHVLLSGQTLSVDADGRNVRFTASGVEEVATDRQLRDLPNQYTTLASFEASAATIYAAEEA